MDNKKFAGYFILGTKSQEDAEHGKGLILWLQSKPSGIRRWLNKVVLGIRWVDTSDYKPVSKEVNTTKTEMPKRNVYKKTADGSNQERRDTKSSSSSSRE